MRAVVVGASGGIGRSLALGLGEQGCQVEALSRSGRSPQGPGLVAGRLDLDDENSVRQAAERIRSDQAVDLVLVATGLLSDGAGLAPEKSYRQQSRAAFERVFAVNTIGPALVAKHFLPIMPREGRAIFAVLSARVGSISDNAIGGWHAYRASKAALNMLIRSYAIEQRRRNQEFIAVSLHPGTVDTPLSKPFQANVPPDRLFRPEHAASCLLRVLAGLQPSDSGKAFDWKGAEIPA